jgi:hypothetical protein
MTGAVVGADDESRYFSRCSAGIRDRSYANQNMCVIFRAKDLSYLVDVQHGLPLVVALQMEVAHSHLSAKMLLASNAIMLKGLYPTNNQGDIYPSWFGGGVGLQQGHAGNVSEFLVVVFGSATYTSRVLAMFADTSISSTDMAPVLSRFAQVSRHVDRVVFLICLEVKL